MTHATSNLAASQINKLRMVTREKPILTIQLLTKELSRVHRVAASNAQAQSISRVHNKEVSNARAPVLRRAELMLKSGIMMSLKKKQVKPVIGKEMILIQKEKNADPEIKTPGKEICKNIFCKPSAQAEGLFYLTEQYYNPDQTI
jgi:hypothetical protein